MGSSPHLEKHDGWCSLCGIRCAVAGCAVCRQFKSSSSARPCLSCLSTGDSASRRTRNMPDKKWQKQTDGDECRQILRASASAENERNATVSGLEIQNYRVSSKTVPTWLFALLSASTHANCKSWVIYEKFRKFATR